MARSDSEPAVVPSAAKEAAEKVKCSTLATEVAHENQVFTAALKRCVTQNQTFSAASKAAMVPRRARAEAAPFQILFALIQQISVAWG